MKIYQGIDIVEITRFRKMCDENSMFIPDIFTPKEIEYCESRKDSYMHFAGRFAAKEAGMKALGMGMSGAGIDNAFKEIETLPTSSGKPELSFSGWIGKICRKKQINQFTVSISHSANYAVATVILTGPNTV